MQINASIVVDDRELRYDSSTLPEVLKVDLEATVEIGIANISLAILARTGYRLEFSLHHIKTSNSPSGFKSATKYAVTSEPDPVLPLDLVLTLDS